MPVVGIEYREIAPGHVITEVVRSLVFERTVAFDRQLSREIGDLLVGAEVSDPDVERQHGREIAG
ncbi:hypothetical protein D3C77_779780 [compost metagenome]